MAYIVMAMAATVPSDRRIYSYGLYSYGHGGHGPFGPARPCARHAVGRCRARWRAGAGWDAQLDGGSGRRPRKTKQPTRACQLYSYGLYSYGLYSCGLNSYGVYIYGPYSYGLCSYDLGTSEDEAADAGREEMDADAVGECERPETSVLCRP